MLKSRLEETPMDALEVFDPTGATEVTRLHAPRLPDLEGKTVAFLSNDMWQAHRMLPMLREMLQARFDGIRIIPESEFPMGNVPIDRDDTVDQVIARNADAVIIGNAS
jgi:hypothetical protein